MHSRGWARIMASAGAVLTFGVGCSDAIVAPGDAGGATADAGRCAPVDFMAPMNDGDVLVAADFAATPSEWASSNLAVGWSFTSGYAEALGGCTPGDLGGCGNGPALLSRCPIAAPAGDFTVEYDFFRTSSMLTHSRSNFSLNGNVELGVMGGDLTNKARIYDIDHEMNLEGRVIVTYDLDGRPAPSSVRAPLALRTWYHVHVAFCAGSCTMEVTPQGGGAAIATSTCTSTSIVRPPGVTTLWPTLVATNVGDSFDKVRIVLGCH